MFSHQKRIRFSIIILSFIILSISSVFLFMHTKILFGASDLQFHIKRIMELKTSINNKNILPAFSFNYFHGSAIMSMYPYINLFIFIIILKFTSSIICAYYLYFIISIFIVLTVSFLSSIKFSKSYKISYLFSIIYGMSSIFIFSAFVSGDIGVFSSLIFLPLVIFGFLNVLLGSGHYLELVLGLFLMLGSQLSAVSIICAFLLLWLLLNFKYITKYKLYIFFKSSCLVLLLSSIILIPIFHIILFNKINNVGSKQLTGFTLKQALENLGIIPIISIIVIPFFCKYLNKIEKQMYLLSILIIFISSKLFPLKFLMFHIPILSILNKYQFTFRFLIIPQILLSFVISVILVNLLKFIHYKNITYLFIILLIFSGQVMTQTIVLNKKNSTTYQPLYSSRDVKLIYTSKLNKHKHYAILNNHEGKYFINGYYSNNDYFPSSSYRYKNMIFNNRLEVNNRLYNKFHHNGYNSFIFFNNRNISQETLPLLKYNRENLKIYLNNHLVRYHVNHHLITLNNVKHGENSLNVRYISNSFINLCELVPFIGGLLWMLLLLLNRIKMLLICKLR